MDNLNQSLEKSNQASESKASWPLIAFIIVVMIAIGIGCLLYTSDAADE